MGSVMVHSHLRTISHVCVIGKVTLSTVDVWNDNFLKVSSNCKLVSS